MWSSGQFLAYKVKKQDQLGGFKDQSQQEMIMDGLATLDRDIMSGDLRMVEELTTAKQEKRHQLRFYIYYSCSIRLCHPVTLGPS